jgi:hypothetical protein
LLPNLLKTSSTIVQSARRKNETLQVVGFEGFFNLKNSLFINRKSAIVLNLNELVGVRILLDQSSSNTSQLFVAAANVVEWLNVRP